MLLDLKKGVKRLLPPQNKSQGFPKITQRGLKESEYNSGPRAGHQKTPPSPRQEGGPKSNIKAKVNKWEKKTTLKT